MNVNENRTANAASATDADDTAANSRLKENFWDLAFGLFAPIALFFALIFGQRRNPRKK